MAKNLWAALDWAGIGWPVFPLVDAGYLPRIPSPHGMEEKCRGECGRFGHGVYDATTDPFIIECWWRMWPDAGIGGALADRLVVDIDPRNGGHTTWSEAVNAGRQWPDTREHHTKRSGRHLIFECDAELAAILNQRPVLGRGIDIKSGPSSYVVLPPTPGYEVYSWIDPVPLPDELVEAANKLEPRKAEGGETRPPRYGDGEPGTQYGVKALKREVGKLEKSWDGTGEETFNNQLNKSSFAVGQLVGGGELDPDATLAALEGVLKELGAPPDQYKTLASGWESGLKSPRSAPAKKGKPLATNDVGNMERFVRDHAGAVKHADGIGWLWWDGRKWRRHSHSMVRMLAVQTAKSIYQEAAGTQDRDREKALAQWAHQSQFNSRISAMVELARHHPEIRVEADELDKDPYLLTVANCTINLRTGERLDFNPDHLITRSSPIDYDRSEPCPQFDQFMAWFCQGDVETIEYLQMLVGQTLIGSNAAQVFIFLYGPGGNGKSQFIEIIQGLMGEWTEVADARIFLSARNMFGGGGHNADLAKLAGSRFVPVSETQQGRQWDEALIKQISGGDRMTASFKGMQPFDFTPGFTVWVYGNHEPVIKGDDDGIWRRVRRINTSAKVEDSQKREEYGRYLLTNEGAGIMAWAVRGAILAAQTPGGASGFKVPDMVRMATESYRESQDELGIFIDSHLAFVQGQRTSNAELWSTFLTWQAEGGAPFARNATDLAKQVLDWASRHDQSVRRVRWDHNTVRGLSNVTPRTRSGNGVYGARSAAGSNGQMHGVTRLRPRAFE